MRQIQYTLEESREVELRCMGTASEKGIVISEACIEEGIKNINVGFAKYIRFTTQTVLHNGR